MANDERQYLSYNIKFLRKKNRMTQSELARQLGVRQTTVSEWEKGRSEPDSVSLLKKICQIFNVTFDQILDDYINSPKTTKNITSGTIARRLDNLTDEERNQAEQHILSFLNEYYGKDEE